jgi:hypothetical protein
MDAVTNQGREVDDRELEALLGQVAPSARPSRAAWEAIVGAVEHLERELAPGSFARAIDALEAHLEPWPDALRPAPAIWYGDYVHGHGGPKLRLPRAFELREMDLPKDASAWLTGFAARADLSHITHLSMGRVPKAKHFQKAALAMFEATRPRTWELVGFHDAAMAALSSLIEAQGFQQRPRPQAPTPDAPGRSGSPECLGQREVWFEVADLEGLTSTLSRQDMDHVVSLNLSFDKTLRPDAFDLEVAPASWEGLRFLTVGKAAPAIIDAVTVWLSRARPVCVREQFNLLRLFAPDQPMRLAEAGVYARALGSGLELPVGADPGRLRELLSREDVWFGDLRLANMTGESVGIQELVEAMRPELRANLRRLDWVPRESDLGALDAILSDLPRLTHLTLIGVELAERDGRASALAALADAPASARLTTFELYARGAKHAAISAAEKKALARGRGAGAEILRLR